MTCNLVRENCTICQEQFGSMLSRVTADPRVTRRRPVGKRSLGIAGTLARQASDEPVPGYGGRAGRRGAKGHNSSVAREDSRRGGAGVQSDGLDQALCGETVSRRTGEAWVMDFIPDQLLYGARPWTPSPWLTSSSGSARRSTCTRAAGKMARYAFRSGPPGSLACSVLPRRTVGQSSSTGRWIWAPYEKDVARQRVQGQG